MLVVLLVKLVKTQLSLMLSQPQMFGHMVNQVTQLLRKQTTQLIGLNRTVSM